MVQTCRPGLLPLAALGYSALNSWHCSVMCGALAFHNSPQESERFAQVRLASYTAMGALMGGAGQVLRRSLEFDLFRIVGLSLLILVGLVFVLPELLPFLPRLPLRRVIPWRLGQHVGPWMKGSLISLTPCHLLAYYYALAAFIGSPAWGAALLFGHAVMTTPSLLFARHLFKGLHKGPALLRIGLRVALTAMVVLNLWQLASGLVHLGPDNTPGSTGMCF